MTRVADLFVEAGVLAHETGDLPDALELLAIRLDLAGAGELLATLTRTCWQPEHELDTCPSCGAELKGTPNPHRPPPPPPPPPPGGK